MVRHTLKILQHLGKLSIKGLWILSLDTAEASTGGVVWKKVFLILSQNSEENTCARVSFSIKLQASGPQLH